MNNNYKILILIILILPFNINATCTPNSELPCDDTSHLSSSKVIVPVVIVVGLGAWYFTKNKEKQLKFRQQLSPLNWSITSLSPKEKNKFALQFSYDF